MPGRKPIAWLVVILCVFVSLPGAGLGEQTRSGCYDTFEVLLEKTMLKVDVILLTLQVDAATGRAVEALRAGQKRSRKTDETIGQRYLEATWATARMQFLRDIGTERFLDGAAEGTGKIAKQGWLTKEKAAVLREDMQQRFTFLGERGILEGDVLHYTLRADSVWTHYISVEGDTLLADVRVGRERRVAMLGSYFARKTNFQDDLLDQVFTCSEEGSP